MGIASAIGGIASAVGGLLGSDKSSDLAEKQMRQQKKIAYKNIRYQKKFAKRGIRWKTKDVIRAAANQKLHPLALLGMQTHSFSPVSIGSTPIPDTASAYANAGQDLGRAATALSPSTRQQQAQDKALAALTLERASLENDLLRTKIASGIRTGLQPGTGPGIGPNNSPAAEDPQQSTRMMTGGNDPFSLPSIANPVQDYPDLEQWFLYQAQKGNLGPALRDLASKNLPAWMIHKYRQHGEKLKPYDPPPDFIRGPYGPHKRPRGKIYYAD